tara:strand:+ start:1677 stop:1844 length:168 start_codon:yes stop_codon:yes gene_type:complete
VSCKSIDKLNDVLAEIAFLVGELSPDVDQSTKDALKTTHALAWQIIEYTMNEVEI